AREGGLRHRPPPGRRDGVVAGQRRRQRLADPSARRRPAARRPLARARQFPTRRGARTAERRARSVGENAIEMALRTRRTELLDIQHPVILGGMGRGATVPPMVAAVSEAGGLGVLGVSRYPAEQVAESAAAVRAATSRPFGLNLLMFVSDDDAVATVLAQRPPVLSTAWPWPDRDLRAG